MESKIILFLLFSLVNSNSLASCRDHGLGKALTVTGWTPEEAYQKLHLELPKLGVLQTVNLESVKAMTSDSYKESTAIYRSIYANIDMIAIYHCRIDNMYAITASIPDGSVNYYPELIQTWLKNRHPRKDDWFVKFWTFESAKKYCGAKPYSLITVDYRHVVEVEGSFIAHREREWGGPDVTHVICGSGWKAMIYSNKGEQYYNRPHAIYKHKGKKYVQLFGDEVHYHGDWSKYMELQMLQNALGK